MLPRTYPNLLLLLLMALLLGPRILTPGSLCYSRQRQCHTSSSSSSSDLTHIMKILLLLLLVMVSLKAMAGSQ
jgi:hypothetical protein